MSTLSVIVSHFYKVVALLRFAGFTVNQEGTIEYPKEKKKYHQDLLLSLYLGKAVEALDGKYYVPIPVPVKAATPVLIAA